MGHTYRGSVEGSSLILWTINVDNRPATLNSANNTSKGHYSRNVHSVQEDVIYKAPLNARELLHSPREEYRNWNCSEILKKSSSMLPTRFLLFANSCIMSYEKRRKWKLLGMKFSIRHEPLDPKTLNNGERWSWFCVFMELPNGTQELPLDVPKTSATWVIITPRKEIVSVASWKMQVAGDW